MIAILVGLASIMCGFLVDAQSQYFELPELDCPAEGVKKDEAYDDFKSDESLGLMDCYCN